MLVIFFSLQGISADDFPIYTEVVDADVEFPDRS